MKSFIEKKYIILLLILILIVILFRRTKTEEVFKAEKGVLDLTAWNFKGKGTLNLDGEWEFYWNQLLDYDDFYGGNKEYRPDGYFSVPSTWNKYEIDGRELPGKGHATYRLKVKTNNTDDLKGIKVLTESTAYKLMINGKTIAVSGIVGDDEKTDLPEYKPQIAHFANNSNEFEVILQVSNYTYARGGFWHSIEFGSFEQIKTTKENSARKEMLLLGAICSMIIYHIAIYWLQRRNKSVLYFIMALIVMSVRILFTGEYFITALIPNISFEVLIFIEYMTVYWGAIVWLIFVNNVYPEESSIKSTRILVGISLLIGVFIGAAPIYIYTKYIFFIEIFFGIICYKIVSVILKALYRKKQGATLLFLGIVLFSATYIHDALYYSNIIESEPGGLIGFTTFIMLFIQAYILAARYSKTFDEVEELSQKMISLNKLKDEFLVNASHELRTPLHGMVSITESVLRDMETEGNIKQKQKENLLLVISSGKRLANIVNVILDYSKLKHGDIKLNRGYIDLHQVVQKVVTVQRYLIINKEVLLINNIPKDFPFVDGDEDRIIQIIYNLLGNAIKFTDKGKIIISAAENNNMAEISIEDTGIGIPEEKLKDIFKSFEHNHEYLSNSYGGNGLGLGIAKQLVEMQGGKIWALSEVGRRSKFVFTLPISTNKREAVAPGGNDTLEEENSHNLFSEMAVSIEPAKEFTVLIVDDDYINLQSLTNILSDEKHTIIAATSAIQSLDIVSRNKEIDLVIMDTMMPQMSGYEACRRIREQYSIYDLPVIMLTAQNNPEAILTGFESGANDFLSKPFEMDELKARVKTLIKLKRSVQDGINAEMAFLQAQIKPHFLYNALNTIVSFCWTDPEKAAELITELSNYLRSSFDFSNMDRFVHIEKEIDFVQSYLVIEKARFEEKINCQYTIDDISFMIPTLILQPIVENAVKHGILKKENGGNINISIKQEHEFIIIKVEDDGVGMTKEKLKNILSEKSINGSVGIRNVDKRLKRIYGYGLKIESEAEKGTKVYIRIPIDGGGAFDQNHTY